MMTSPLVVRLSWCGRSIVLTRRRGREARRRCATGNVAPGPGQFFGEIAALKRTRRSATVRALSRVNVLALDVADLRALMLREPAIARRVLAVAWERAGGDVDKLEGDMIAAELPGGDPASSTRLA